MGFTSKITTFFRRMTASDEDKVNELSSIILTAIGSLPVDERLKILKTAVSIESTIKFQIEHAIQIVTNGSGISELSPDQLVDVHILAIVESILTFLGEDSVPPGLPPDLRRDAVDSQVAQRAKINSSDIDHPSLSKVLNTTTRFYHAIMSLP